MANVNKVVDRNGNVVIDISTDTVVPSKVLSGTKFHGADGKEYTGTLTPNELDSLKYTFIDYDGEVMYTFTDAEIDAMSELPAGPDHTDDNLTFQEWNWTLEALKAWDRTRPDRPIVGATLITTDGKTYYEIEILNDNTEVTFSVYNSNIEVDWGDETVTTDKYKHTYASAGTYIISANTNNNYFLPSTKTGPFIKSLKIGNSRSIDSTQAFYYCYFLKKVNLPVGLIGNNYFGSEMFSNCYGLKAAVIPYNENGISLNATFYNCYSLETISLPPSNFTSLINAFYGCRSLKNIVTPIQANGTSYENFFARTGIESAVITNATNTYYCFEQCYRLKNVIINNDNNVEFDVGSNAFSTCYSLRSIELPKNTKTIGSYAFSTCASLESLIIPDSVTSIGNYAFNGCNKITLDLSQQTKIISLTGTIFPTSGTNNYKILVPAALLDAYKSASYWSNYAAVMVGV